VSSICLIPRLRYGGPKVSQGNFVHSLPIEWQSDPIQWHHIGTKLNIADIASRGMSVADISADSTWIQGPEFLKSEFSEWPVDKVAVDFLEPNQAELKKSVLKAKVAPAKPVIDPAAYSNWIKLTRITAWIFRMCNNLRNKGKV
jgi:hypothetical protein